MTKLQVSEGKLGFMDTRIRPATLSDIDLIERWGRALYKVELAFEPHIRYFGDRYRERDIKQLSSPDALYLIAEAQNQPVGYVSASLTDMPEHLALSGRECVIEVVYIEKFARGEGVADKLVEACFSWLQEKGVRRVRAGIYAQNRASLRPFEKFGFQPYHVTVSRTLD